MRFIRLISLLTLEAALVVQATLPDIQQLESLASSALATAYGLLHANTLAGSTCNALSVQVRKEW